MIWNSFGGVIGPFGDVWTGPFECFRAPLVVSGPFAGMRGPFRCVRGPSAVGAIRLGRALLGILPLPHKVTACGVRGCPYPPVHSALAAEPSHLLNAMAAKHIQSAAAFVCLAVAAAKQPIVEFFHTSGLSYWE